MPDTLQLQDLPQGKCAQVVDLIGKSADVLQLCEIGMRIGVSLVMMQTGKACVIRVNGSKICLRPHQVQVIVQPV
jgi:Fe2+ transport system protein FeoA